MAVLSGGAAWRESVTFDEIAHIGAGITYLQKLDMRLNLEHPPLAKMIAAAPLVLRGVHTDYSHISWSFSGKGVQEFLGEWVWGHWLLMRWNDPYTTLWWARVPMLGVTLLLGLVIYLFGTRLGGTWGGLLCLTAYVSMPAFLTFGPLVVTDVVVTLFWVLAVWKMPEMWRSPSRGTVMKFGLILAAAFLSKFSAGLLFFVFIAIAISLRLRSIAEQPSDRLELRRWRRRAWWNMFKATAWAALFVYFFYLIFSWRQPTTTFDLIPHFPASLFLRRLLMPIWLYLGGVALFAVSAGSRATYILGHSYPHGVWFYFPTLFFLKTPLAFLLLLALAIAVAIFVKRISKAKSPAVAAGTELNWRALWVSLIVYVIICMLNRLDLSIRHFLIAIAESILLLAPLPRMLQSLREANSKAARPVTWVTAGLAIVSLVTAIRAYPNYMPFLNALSLGRPGYMLVNDSNLDWNHALPEVEKFVHQRGLNSVLLDDYGFYEPTVYVPEAQLWSCQQATAADSNRWAVVSASSIADAHNCLWLLKHPQQTVVLAGGSMYAFLLPAVIPPPGSPDGPPLPANYQYMGGMGLLGDPRDLFLACIRDPNQMQPTLDRMMAAGKAMQEKERQEKSKKQ